MNKILYLQYNLTDEENYGDGISASSLTFNPLTNLYFISTFLLGSFGIDPREL